MSVKVKYRTKQREELLSYLESVPGIHLTVSDICARLQEMGSPMGQTTVYRQLESLLDEGLVNKYTLDAKCPACYEYIPRDSHAAPSCFHCKCYICGKLYHLHCPELESISSHLLEEHHFLLDQRRTVFFGLCEQCQQLQRVGNPEEKDAQAEVAHEC